MFQGSCPATTDVLGPPSDYFYSPIKGSDINWNFEKFLIDGKGRPRYRFYPGTLPSELNPYIRYLIQELKEESNILEKQRRREKVSGNSGVFRG